MFAVYSGDNNFQSNQGTQNVSVVLPSTVTVTSSAMSSTPTLGTMVTFTATVTGTGATPTGTVALYLGMVKPADQIGTGTLSVVNGQYQVTFSTPVLPVSGSPYTLTAVYGGDANHQPSTSPAATISPSCTIRCAWTGMWYLRGFGFFPRISIAGASAILV